MAKRKAKNPNTGQTVDATVIEIKELSERPIVITLADDTVLRLRVDIVEIVRFDDEWDREGNPLYQIKSGNIMTVLESSERLKKKD